MLSNSSRIRLRTALDQAIYEIEIPDLAEEAGITFIDDTIQEETIEFIENIRQKLYIVVNGRF